MKERCMRLKSELCSPTLVQGVCFALCFFAFQLTEFAVNDRAAAVLGADSVMAVYCGGLLCTALGFMSFSVVRFAFHGEIANRIILCAVGAAAVLSAAAMMLLDGAAAFSASVALALFSLGHIGGRVYHSAAAAFFAKAYSGRIIGVGMGAAVVMQFVVLSLLKSSAAFVLSVAVSLAAIIYFEIKPMEQAAIEPPQSSSDSFNRRGAVSLVVAVALMSLVCAILDGAVVPADASGQTSAAGFVRLLYAASLVAAGFIADVKQRRLLPLFTVCFMFFSVAAAAFFSSEPTYWIGTAFIYMYSGFYVMFLTVEFLDIAPKTPNPPFWACMGRTVRSLTVAVATLPTALLVGRFGSVAIVAGSCVLSVIIMMLMLKDVSSALLPSKSESPYQTDAAADGDKINRYAERFGFTGREREVFEKLIMTEDGVQEIADGLYISRRVLQRYISSVYAKTSTKTRIGLFRSYTEF